jgi:hypothetical protein
MSKTHPGTFENRGTHQRLILYCGGRRHTFRLDTFDKKASAKFAREKLRELAKQLDRAKRGIAGTTRFSALLDQFARAGVEPGNTLAAFDGEPANTLAAFEPSLGAIASAAPSTGASEPGNTLAAFARRAAS